VELARGSGGEIALFDRPTAVSENSDRCGWAGRGPPFAIHFTPERSGAVGVSVSVPEGDNPA
jgi:hypothetical protein